MNNKIKYIFLIIFVVLLLAFTAYMIIDAHNNPPCNVGTVTIHAWDGMTYGYYGDIRIINDGTNGKDIYIILDGFLQSYHNTELEN